MRRKLFNDYLTELKKDDIIKYYITDNHTCAECISFFNVSMTTFMRILKAYNIKKPKDLHTIQIKKSKLKKYGNENYNNTDKRTQTNIEKYGVENQFQREDIIIESQKVKETKYGSKNNIIKNHQTRIKNSGSLEQSYQSQIDTYKQTCLQRYQVLNTAQLRTSHVKAAETRKKAQSEEGIYFDSGWEALVYDYARSKEYQIEYQVPVKYNNAQQVTFIDFKINDQLYEVKGPHLLNEAFTNFSMQDKIKCYQEYNVHIITKISDLHKDLTGLDLIDINNLNF